MVFTTINSPLCHLSPPPPDGLLAGVPIRGGVAEVGPHFVVRLTDDRVNIALGGEGIGQHDESRE